MVVVCVWDTGQAGLWGKLDPRKSHINDVTPIERRTPPFVIVGPGGVPHRSDNPGFLGCKDQSSLMGPLGRGLGLVTCSCSMGSQGMFLFWGAR
jgi:hypothetical protein